MNAATEKMQAIANNYQAFEAMLPLLLRDHKGKFALLRDGQVVEFFDTAGMAQIAGIERFDDALFSVQKVIEEAIDLGFYSHARYRRYA